MKFILGFVLVIFCVLGGYVFAEGHLIMLMQPFEFMIIAGGSLGAMIIANPGKVTMQVITGSLGLVKASPFNKSLYMDMLALMFSLFAKARKEGLMSLENDIEEPKQSELFRAFPKVTANHHAEEFICDYLRLMVGGNMNAFELENLMDIELETAHGEGLKPSEALQTVADGLPGFGIVAAVMGVVITMGYISEPPEVLGHHIAAALVGTFLGILLSYGFAAPMSSALKQKAEAEHKFVEVIKVCIMGTLNGYTPQIAVEFGRKAIPSSARPGFAELEEYVKKRKA